MNLHLVEQLKKEAFTYDQAYLDELGELFISYQDTCAGLQQFRQYLQQARAYVQGKALQEGEIITPDGEKTSLLSQLKKDRYTVIDFWGFLVVDPAVPASLTYGKCIKNTGKK